MKSKVRIRMHRKDFQRVDIARPGCTLFCDNGVLWVTQADDRRDYVLTTGQRMTVTKRGKVLVEAMRDADFHVV